MIKDWILLRLIPLLGWMSISLIGKTVRLKVIGEESVKAIKESGGHVIYAFWHNRLLLITYALRHRGIIVLISSSRDGEYITRTIHKFGTGAVRGSTTFRGARALLRMNKKLKSGYDGAVTPDGPQGPRYQVQPGIIHLAKRTGLPIVPVTYGAGRKMVRNSWDGFIIPHPFSRAVLIYGSPVEVPLEGTDKDVKVKRQELEQSLNTITKQADDCFKYKAQSDRGTKVRRDRLGIVIEIAQGQGKGFLVSFLRAGLAILSGVYYLLVESRSFLYRSRLLRSKKLPAYTISVGNITVGGTGKTPAVAMLAGELQKGKRKVAILSRGYKRIPGSLQDTGGQAGVGYGKVGIVSDGKNILMGVREAGDEPYLLAKKLPGVAVLVGKDRFSSGKYALDNLGVDTLILDDGYQHWPLGRDLDMVVIDSTNPFGNGYLLPRGRLREPLKNLKRGDLFLLTRVDQADDLEDLIERLRKIKPGAKIVETVHHPDHLIDFKTGERQELTVLSGKNVLALSSIGHPESFEKTLSNLGSLLVEKVRFPDHHWHKETELKEIGEKALQRGAELIVTTEKDAVRIPPGTKPPVELLYLTIKLKVVKGREILEEMLQRVS